ncbi:MAG: hypothetical protein ACD_10C00071G0005, partial [uncultured bacterium]
MAEQMINIPMLKSARNQRIGRWLMGVFLAFGLFGYFAAPPLVKLVLLKQLEQQLHREVSIEKVDINPYALSARISGLSVKAASGKEIAGFDELLVNLSSASIFKFAAVVDEVRLQGLRIVVARVADGRYDISDLLDKWLQPKDQAPGQTPRFSINNIQLIGGRIEFADQPKGKVHTVSAINLSLPFISTLPYQAEILVEPSFSASFNGSPLALTGRSKPFAESHESVLDIDLDHFDLADLQAYLPESLPFRLDAGMLDSELKIVFKELADQVFSLTVIGGVHVSALSLSESNGSPLVGWKRLDIELDNTDLINQQIAVKRVALDGLDLALSVSPQGELNVLTLAAKLAQPAAKTPEPPPAGGKALAWSLGEFALTDGLLRWKDASNVPLVVGEVRHLQVSVGKLDSKLADPIEIGEASYQIDLGERFRVEKMTLKGIRVDLPAHRVEIAEVTNSQARARMLRHKTGRIEWVSPPVLKTIRATEAKVDDKRAWIGKVNKLTIEDLGFRFEDQSIQTAAVQQLDGFNLQAENLTNEPGQKGSISLQGKINKNGRLKAAGSVRIFPLDLALKLETARIPLLPLQPYFAEQVNIALTRGQFSNKGEARFLIDQDGLKAAYNGSLTLGNVLAVDKENSADFLKWKSLFLGGVDFRLAPLAINVGEIALSDFYSKLVLSEAGRLNVQDIVRKPAVAVAPKVATETTPASEALPTPAAKPEEKPAMPIKIAKITLQNGAINFSDFFVKPNYSVTVTKLGGRITGLSS